MMLGVFLLLVCLVHAKEETGSSFAAADGPKKGRVNLDFVNAFSAIAGRKSKDTEAVAKVKQRMEEEDSEKKVDAEKEEKEAQPRKDVSEVVAGPLSQPMVSTQQLASQEDLDRLAKRFASFRTMPVKLLPRKSIFAKTMNTNPPRRLFPFSRFFDLRHAHKSYLRSRISSNRYARENAENMPWVSKLNNTILLEYVDKATATVKNEVGHELYTAVSRTFVWMVQLHIAMRVDTCSNRTECASMDEETLSLFRKLLLGLELTRELFEQSLPLSAPHRKDILDKYADDYDIGRSMLVEWSLNRHFLPLDIAIASTILSALAILYLGGLILLGIFYLKLQLTDGKNYLVVAGGLALAAVLRLTRSIIGFTGAGPAFSVPMIVPVVFGTLVFCIVCVSLWYFAFLWVSAYVQVFLRDDKRGAFLVSSLKVATAVIAVVLPVLTIVQTVLYHYKDSPMVGRFPQIVVPITVFLSLSAISGLIVICVMYLRRFKLSKESGETVDRRYVVAAVRMLVVCGVLWLAYAGGLMANIYVIVHAQYLALEDKMDLAFGFLVGFMEAISIVGFAIILTFLLFGDRCSCSCLKKRGGDVQEKQGGLGVSMERVPLLAEQGDASNPYRASSAPNAVPAPYNDV